MNDDSSNPPQDPLIDLVRTRLQVALEPSELELRDDSAKHAGHAGAQGGARHLAVSIVSNVFLAKSRIARHRLVYDALSDLIPQRIHALIIDAKTPDSSSSS